MSGMSREGYHIFDVIRDMQPPVFPDKYVICDIFSKDFGMTRHRGDVFLFKISVKNVICDVFL